MWPQKKDKNKGSSRGQIIVQKSKENYKQMNENLIILRKRE